MIQLVSNKITDKLIENGIIDNQEKEIYIYGLQQGMTMILNIATTLLIGILFQMVWQSIVFMLAYIPLRSYAGGYHAKTQLRCHMLSVILITVALLGIKMIQWTNFSSLLATFLSGVVIFALAPVADKNKPLDQKEKVVYKKKAIIILSILISAIVLLLLLGKSQILLCITMALVILSFMLVLGRIVHKNADLELESQDV